MFEFGIVPIRRKSNQVADRLSRRKSRTTGPNGYSEELLSKVMQKTSFMGAMSTFVPGSRLTKTLISEYYEDPIFNESLRHSKEPFEVKNGLLFRDSRFCMPVRSIRIKLLHDYHSTPRTGHLGETKTLNPLLLLYYWRNMRKTVEVYIKSCRVCQQTRHETVSCTDCFNQ